MEKGFFFLRIFVNCSLCLNVFLPPLPKGQCPILLDFLEKSWKEVVSDCKTFALKGSKNAAKKKFLFWWIVLLKNLSLFCFLVIYYLSHVTSNLSPVTNNFSLYFLLKVRLEKDCSLTTKRTLELEMCHI